MDCLAVSKERELTGGWQCAADVKVLKVHEELSF